MRRLPDSPELLDGPLDAATLRGNLRDLARVNRWLGGTDVSWQAIRPYLNGSRTTTMLDIGTGGGDIPRELRRRAAPRFPLKAVGTDARTEIVELARAANEHNHALEVRLDTADRIGADDASFDIVHSSLVLHHQEPAAAAGLLAEMKRVARDVVIVNDLTRGYLWWLSAWALAHLLTGNRYTRHDAGLSVRRAYLPEEIRQMGASVGLRQVACHWTRPPYRYALVFARESGPRG